MAKIFVSYRREDSPGHSGRLYDHLIAHLGEDLVFRDIEAIELGVDFVKAIEEAVGSCDILVAVIGPQWLTIKDKHGQPRLDNPRDWVRLEIAAALARDVRVIPVLVGDAKMPTEEELPPDLVPLARRNAIEVSDLRFRTDVERLIHSIESALKAVALGKGETPPRKPVAPPPSPPEKVVRDTAALPPEPPAQAGPTREPRIRSYGGLSLLSVLTSLLSPFIFVGLFAVAYSRKVKKALRTCDLSSAGAASSKARSLSIAALAGTLVFYVVALTRNGPEPVQPKPAPPVQEEASTEPTTPTPPPKEEEEEEPPPTRRARTPRPRPRPAPPPEPVEQPEQPFDEQVIPGQGGGQPEQPFDEQVIPSEGGGQPEQPFDEQVIPPG